MKIDKPIVILLLLIAYVIGHSITNFFSVKKVASSRTIVNVTLIFQSGLLFSFFQVKAEILLTKHRYSGPQQIAITHNNVLKTIFLGM